MVRQVRYERAYPWYPLTLSLSKGHPSAGAGRPKGMVRQAKVVNVVYYS